LPVVGALRLVNGPLRLLDAPRLRGRRGQPAVGVARSPHGLLQRRGQASPPAPQPPPLHRMLHDAWAFGSGTRDRLRSSEVHSSSTAFFACGAHIFFPQWGTATHARLRCCTRHQRTRPCCMGSSTVTACISPGRAVMMSAWGTHVHARSPTHTTATPHPHHIAHYPSLGTGPSTNTHDAFLWSSGPWCSRRSCSGLGLDEYSFKLRQLHPPGSCRGSNTSPTIAGARHRGAAAGREAAGRSLRQHCLGGLFRWVFGGWQCPQMDLKGGAEPEASGRIVAAFGDWAAARCLARHTCVTATRGLDHAALYC
jgi:hypothetical protein